MHNFMQSSILCILIFNITSEVVVMPRVVHFELEADKPERAAKFYEKAFGWKFKQWEDKPYWMIDTGKGKGIGGGLSKKTGKQHVVNAIDVPSIDKYIEKVKKAGGTLMTKKMSIPKVGYLVNFKDTEGNIFSMIEYNKKAK